MTSDAQIFISFFCSLGQKRMELFVLLTPSVLIFTTNFHVNTCDGHYKI